MYLFSTTSTTTLARKVAHRAKFRLGRLTWSRFSDGEIYLRVHEKILGKRVWIIGNTGPDAATILELILLTQTLKDLGAKSFGLIIPYLGYSRADHRNKPGEALGAKVMANLLKKLKPYRLITVDLHSHQVIGFFPKNTIHLRAHHLFAKTLRSRASTRSRSSTSLSNWVIVAPDHGALVPAKPLAKLLKTPLAWFEKIRPKPNVATLKRLHGAVKGKNILLVDDMIDTAGTIVQAVKILKLNGARKIIVACTHPVLSGPALRRLKEAPIDRIVVSDTIDLPKGKRIKKLHILSMAKLIANKLI